MVADPEALLDAIAAAEPIGAGQATTVRHHLAAHPLLTREALAEVARRLPPAWAPCQAAGGVAAPTRATAHQVISSLERTSSMARLLHLEHLPAYRELLERLLGDLDRQAPHPGRSRPDGVAFLAPPGAVTPLHCDHHHNLLLQVAGRKELTLGYFDSPALTQLQVEASVALRRNAEIAPARTEQLTLAAGDGLYIPPFGFHAARVLDEPSVALSCSFSTAETDRAVQVHLLNHRLRRLRLPASPPGRWPALDVAKSATARVARRALRPQR